MTVRTQWCAVIFFAVAVVPKSIGAAPEIIRARSAFDGAVAQMQTHPASKGEILSASQIAVLIDEFEKEFEKMVQSTPEMQKQSNEDILNQMKRVKADPYEVEPLIRVVLINGKLQNILAAKRDFDTAERMSKIAKSLEHHLLDVAQIKDAFVDRVHIVRDTSNVKK